MKNQIYFEGKNMEAIYVKPNYEACKTLAEYEEKIGSSAKWAPEFTPNHNRTTMATRTPSAKYQEVVWNKPIAWDESDAPDTDRDWCGKLTYNDRLQPKAVCSRSEEEIADLVSKSTGSVVTKDWCPLRQPSHGFICPSNGLTHGQRSFFPVQGDVVLTKQCLDKEEDIDSNIEGKNAWLKGDGGNNLRAVVLDTWTAQNHHSHLQTVY